MWTDREAEELSVWADDLQRRGDPWGELVATSLAAEASEVAGHRMLLERRVAQLERDVLEPRVRPLLDGFPGIRPIWEHGALVGLRVLDLQHPAPEAVLECLTAWLSLPAARFLWMLRIEAPARPWRKIHEETLPRLLDPDVVARPRVIVLGALPRHVSLLRAQAESDPPSPFGPVSVDLVAPERGLLLLIVDQRRVDLPWAVGGEGRRVQAFARLEAAIRAGPRRLSARDRTLLARALWDRSERVRLFALDCLGELGVEAAPLVPDLMLVDDATQDWRERAGAALAKLAAQPEVVARVAHNFVHEQVGALRWLQTLELDHRARVRIVAMCDEREGVPDWLTTELLAARRRFRPFPEFEHVGGDVGTATCLYPTPRPKSPSPKLFERLRSWWRR
jgi:hypothetical protein